MKAEEFLLYRTNGGVRHFKGVRYWSEDQVVESMKKYARHKLDIQKNEMMKAIEQCEEPKLD